MMLLRLTLSITFCLMLIAAYAPAQNNSLYYRANQPQNQADFRLPTAPSPTAPSPSPSPSPSLAPDHPNPRYPLDPTGFPSDHPSVLQVSWITVDEPSPKNFRVHDLVTIVIQEISKHSTKAETTSERESSIDLKLQEWFRLTKDNIRPSSQKHGEPQLKGSVNREFEGEGDIQREDTLSARIQARIIDVLPNDNLQLEAVHRVTTDDETTQIILTGICRSKDIDYDNTILSSKLAELDIKKNHTGIARDATKRGVLTRLMDFLNPF